MIKYFRFSWDYVLWGISWPNLIMLLNTIPVYTTDADDNEESKEVGGIDDIEDYLMKLG